MSSRISHFLRAGALRQARLLLQAGVLLVGMASTSLTLLSLGLLVAGDDEKPPFDKLLAVSGISFAVLCVLGEWGDGL